MCAISTAVLPRAPQKSGLATASVFSRCYIAQAYPDMPGVYGHTATLNKTAVLLCILTTNTKLHKC